MNKKFFAPLFFKKAAAFRLVALDFQAISLAEGLRAGIAVAAPLILGQLLGNQLFGLAALGALLTCFADPGGPLVRRVPAIVIFAVVSGLTYGAFGLIRAAGIWPAALAGGGLIFCASFARIYGQGGLQAGNLLSVVAVLGLGAPAPGIATAAARGLDFSAGAAWAVLLALGLWQIHPYAPARRALSQAARSLAALAKDLARLAGAQESEAAFEAHAARHRRGVREALEAARITAYETFRRRGLVTARAAQLSVRLQTLEAIFAGLIALSEWLEANPAPRPAAARPLRLAAGWLAALGPDFLAEHDLDTPKRRASLARLRQAVAQFPPGSAPARLLHAMAENLAVLITVSTPAGQKLSGGPAPESLRRKILSPIRANWNFGSAAMRHALRAGLTAIPAIAWMLRYGGPYAHWMTIMLVLCLQPYFSLTWVRTAERIAGTVLGGVIAAAIGYAARTPFELALAMLPLCVFAFTIRGLSFGIFVAALTPAVVLLVEQIAPGADAVTVAKIRVFYTLLGGALAVLANFVLWPGFEGTRLEASILAAKAAHAAFLHAVFKIVLAGGPPPDAARRAAGLASNNLEAALSRALLEPHRRRDPVIERGAVVDAALRRVAGRLAVLALDRPAIAAGQASLWRDWEDFLAARLEGRVRERPENLPEGEGAETLIRLARQMELIAGNAQN